MEGDSLTKVIKKYETVQDIPNHHAVQFSYINSLLLR
jgi:hypothetical protein